MIDPSEVAACLVTRGDCDMTAIKASLHGAGITEIMVWDNSAETVDEGIFGRYAAIYRTKKPVVVTQDDDVIVTCWEDLLEAYEPGVLTVNYPEPYDIPWPSAGSIFDRELPERAFQRYFESYPCDELFTHRICDAVFSLLADKVSVIDEGYFDLPHGFQDGRVSTGGGWYDRDRPEAQRRCRELLEVVS